MTTPVAPTLKKGHESDVLDSYKKFLHTEKSNHDLLFLNEVGIKKFESLKFPRRKHEMFTFVNTTELVSSGLDSYDHRSNDSYTTLIRPHIYPGCGRSLITLVNGVYNESLSDISALDGAVKIKPLDKAVADPEIRQYLVDAVEKENDVFAAVNSAFAAQGILIEIEPFAKLPTPLQILNFSTGLKSVSAMTTPLTFVKAGAGSDAKILLKYAGARCSGFINSVHHFKLEDGAFLKYVQVNDDNHDVWNFAKNRVTLGAGAKFSATDISTGARLYRSHYEARMQGEGAEFYLNSGAVLSGSDQSHVYAQVHHESPNCVSDQIFRNVVLDNSRSSVDTTVIVHRGAQLTKSDQMIKNMVLTDHGHADSKPNLMIYADDVKCAHGATTGKIDEEQLFYMRARGLSEKEARLKLIAGFIEGVFRDVEDFTGIDDIQRSLFSKLELPYDKAG
ncbi:Iron-sulfur cluster assembly protein SufD [hydrothermal vent metagenome]|uniref:Iron-sulfur cluster assembly protein SufD n=1 Tax=hydrothermal vent metagenome TaxID=652676 RepID=A0A3B1C572_9ZZZZ